MNVLFGLMLSLVAASEASPPAWWIEGEAWFAQQGSQGPDQAPFASQGECLGSGWAGHAGHSATYRFCLEQPSSELALHIRYARRDPAASRLEVLWDGKSIAPALACPLTGGWGHLRDEEWQWLSLPLASVAKGWHELKLVSRADKNNTNIDGFLLTRPGFKLPGQRKTIESLPQPPLRRSPEAPGPDCMDERLTLESFDGRVDDWYYPAEEPAQRAALAVPSLVAIGSQEVTLATAKGGQACASIGNEVDGWRVVETLDDPEPCVVLEREFGRWGLIVALGRKGVVAEVRKAVGRLDKIDEPRFRFPKDYFETLLDAREDVLADKVLATGRDPSYEGVAGFLTPLDTYTFLGSPESSKKHVVDPDGPIGTLINYAKKSRLLEEVLFDPAKQMPGLEPTAAKRGLLGGYLPAIDYGFFDSQRQAGYELCAFMETGDSSRSLVRLRRTDGRTSYYRIAPLEELKDGKAFFAGLLKLQRSWEKRLAGGMQLKVADRRTMDVARGSLVLALSGCPGKHPKYGMGGYWGATDTHDGFPPTTLALGSCLLDWGLDEEVKTRLGYYFDRFVKEDGTLRYYGPAVAEYGQLLDLAVAVVERTGDSSWFDRHQQAIERIAGYLRGLCVQAKQSQPADAPTHGLIIGSAEADTRNDTRCYFSGNVWCWRGLREVGRLLVSLGHQRHDDAMAGRGQELLTECESLRADIQRAVSRSVVQSQGRPFLPPIAGDCKPFGRMTENTLASYTNYRYWLEMLSARCLEAKQEEMILDYRQHVGGELLATTRFANHLDDWPYYHQAFGLLSHDRIDRYLLGYFAHIAHHQTPGTFTAYEQVPIRGWRFRRQVADYCIPSQLTAALMTRWMFVFEQRDGDALWLCRAVPRAWYGEELSVTNALTRWGKVSLRLEPEKDLQKITGQITVSGPSRPSLLLRIRHPNGLRLDRCETTGARCLQIDAADDLIRLQPQEETIRVKLSFVRPR